MYQNLNWRNVHGIGFSGSRMENSRENKVKVLNQIKKGDVTVEDRDMNRVVIHIHKYDDYVDLFYAERDDPQEAIEEMKKYADKVRPLQSSVNLCEEIHEPELPDINSDWDVVAYCV